MPSPTDAGRLGFFIAVAALLQAGETLLPSPVPWFRPGLGNALVLAALSLWGFRPGLWVALGKVLLGGLITGRLFSPGFLLALGGATASTAAMALVLALPLPLGFVGVSVLGAAAHAAAQLALAQLLLLGTDAVWAVAPLLGAVSVASGVATGVVAEFFARVTAQETAEETSGGLPEEPR